MDNCHLYTHMAIGQGRPQVGGPHARVGQAYGLGRPVVTTMRGAKRWTPSTGQLINVAKWNLLRYIPVKMRGAEDDKEETAQSCASV